VRLIYSALFYALIPLILARMAWRGRREAAYRKRWRERFACYRQAAPILGVIWFHAVSVGESEAAFPLIRALMRRFPGVPILVTTTTPTGSARVQAVLGVQVAHVYLPYDLPDAMGRFLDHFRPRLAVVMETEIWPNLFHASAARGIPLAIVNARLSERSARGYARLGSFTRKTLAYVRLVAAQTDADAERFLKLSARDGTVVVTGNIKYDLELPPDYFQQAKALRASLFGKRQVWIAASTHEGEEALVLQAFARIRRHLPDLLLVLVPRHPPRFDKVASLCLAEGFRLGRRSLGELGNNAEVFLVDTLGELRLFYAASDIAFVGGSLVFVGGHNVLEPALAGVPVLFGPHMFNFEEAGRRLVEAGGAVQIADGDELSAVLVDLLQDPVQSQRMGEAGQAFVKAGRGALGRVEEALRALLESGAVL
jgi:3-deoxy-D-manno-octulosonic-acid transferase